jgi:hypothetical protein
VAGSARAVGSRRHERSDERREAARVEVAADDERRGVSALHQRPEWREASVGLRVAAWRCAVCRMTPQRAAQLHGAHLLALSEIRREFGSAAARQALTDAENTVSLCRACHRAFDYLLVGVCDPRLLGSAQKGKLWARVARYLPAFAALLGQRVRFRARLRRARAEAESRRTASWRGAIRGDVLAHGAGR